MAWDAGRFSPRSLQCLIDLTSCVVEDGGKIDRVKLGGSDRSESGRYGM